MTTSTTIPEPVATDTRPVRRCEGCGERAGSISAGMGRPLVRDKESGRFFHLSCKPGAMRSGEFLSKIGALSPRLCCHVPEKAASMPGATCHPRGGLRGMDQG
jgi:hypothetical protein